MAQMANVSGNTRRKHDPKDFMPKKPDSPTPLGMRDDDEETRQLTRNGGRMTAVQTRDMLRDLAIAMGGRVVEKGKVVAESPLARRRVANGAG